MNTVRRVAFWLAWFVIVIMAIIPTCYFFSRITDRAFVDSSVGNWFATMIGVAVGIPIALWLGRQQQKEQEKKEQETREQEALDRKAKILSLVRAELEYNHDTLLASTVETDGVTERVVFVNGLKDELWSALSDGGELQWIRDLPLMNVISYAYHYIRRVIYLEKLYLEIKRPPTYQNAPAEQRIEWLIQIDPATLQSIEAALEEIKQSMEALEAEGRLCEDVSLVNRFQEAIMQAAGIVLPKSWLDE